MNLVVIAALVAVAGAAKLDRIYLPPASAKTAGGSPGSLQTPFAGNSFNNGLGGLPKGSYNNDFQGVVVDAAAAGTRAAEDGETGLGAPRISYGSFDSKVGPAAFDANAAGFRHPNFQAGFEGTAPDGQAASTEIQGFQSQGASQGFSSAERPRAALDRAANTLRFESDVGSESFSYSFETDNGISAEENGVATNGVQAQGGFSYTGDDGQVYSVTYTADERGYQPKGDHLPTPPPIPEEILKSLEQNARDEAAGLVDDGSYDAQKYNAGSDYADSDNSNGKYDHQSSNFGNSETDATASGSFISQNNQPFARPGQNGHSSKNSGSSASNALGQSGASTGLPGQGHGQFGQRPSSGEGHFDSDSAQGQFASNSNKFQGHPGTRPVGHSGTNSAQGQFGSSSNKFQGQSGQPGTGPTGHSDSNSAQGQFESNTNRFPGPSGHESSQGQLGSSSNRFNQPDNGDTIGLTGPSGQGSNSLTGPSGFDQNVHGSDNSTPHGQSNSAFGSTATGNNRFEHAEQSGFGNRNEYLPPKNNVNQNRPQNSRQQGSSISNIKNSVPQDQNSNNINQNANFQSFAQQNGQVHNRPLQGSVSGNSRRPGSNGLSGHSGFDSTSGVSSQNVASNNAASPSSNIANNAAQGSSQSFGNRFGSKNEYLPPLNNFGQNNRPNQARPQGSVSSTNSQFSQQYNSNTQISGDFQSLQNQGRPQGSTSSKVPQTGSGFESQFTNKAQSSQQFTGNQRPQSPTIGKPSFQNGNRFPSSQGNGQAQFGSGSSSFASQHATSQPDTELTTPFETSGPQNNGASPSSRPTIQSFTTGSQSSNVRPLQSQFGNRNNNGNAPSKPTSASTFTPFGTQPTSGPQRPKPFDNRQTLSPTFPTQASQFQVDSQFNNGQHKATQTSFSQNADAQFSPSTQRPTFSQQQGPDDSYYYNQPQKPFNVPQGSRFPSAPSDQFNRVTQRPSYSSQNNQLSGSSQQSQSTPFSSKTPQFQGSSKYPRPPTLAPIAPTSSSQSLSNGFNGITQASISPFPSELPTQSTQFTQQGHFGSRPNQQKSPSQFSESGRPSFSQTSSSQASFGFQTTATPSFPQRPTNSRRPSFQGQVFGQQSLNQDHADEETTESTPSQQYNGEIYEYKKPAQTLPAPDHDKDDEAESSSSGQFGQKQQTQFGRQPSKPQFGQTQEASTQFTQTSSRPQLGQNKQTQSGFQDQKRPQFAAQPTKSFSSSTSQFAQVTESEESQPSQEKPQFGGQSAGSPFRPCCQGSKFGLAQGSSFGRPNQGATAQSQFSAQSTSFTGTQGFKPEPTSSFAGKGEVFGGPRKPPSFDAETGYHY